MIKADRIISAKNISNEDIIIENKIRPKNLKDYIGQSQVLEQMGIFIKAAKNRGDAIDHILIYGQPGLGKTTLANIIAKEMEVNIRTTSGPIIEKPGDLAAILTNLEKNEILFIDEIHRLSPVVEEILYPAMEDYKLDIIIGNGPAVRSIKIDIPNFTLIGATSRAGLLTPPLRDRFGIFQKLEFYKENDLKKIIIRSAKLLKINITELGAIEIAKRARGTPRIANRILKRVRDFAEVHGKGIITDDVSIKALNLIKIDYQGFDFMDRKLLLVIIKNFMGGPVGIDNLSTAIGEDRYTIEQILEPFLIHKGFIQRTSRGRIATSKAFKYFGLIK